MGKRTTRAAPSWPTPEQSAAKNRAFMAEIERRPRESPYVTWFDASQQAELDRAISVAVKKSSEALRRAQADAMYGRKYRNAQQNRARRPRSRPLGDGDDQQATLTAIVATLANGRSYEDWTAKELWPELFSSLERVGANPREVGGDFGAYVYSAGADERRIEFETFKNKLSLARRKSR